MNLFNQLVVLAKKVTFRAWRVNTFTTQNAHGHTYGSIFPVSWKIYEPRVKLMGHWFLGSV